MNRILVTPRSLTANGHPALGRLEQAGYQVVLATPGEQPSEQELIDRLPGCVGYLAGVEPISARALAAADALRVISRNGVGVDNIDLAAAEQRGITICRAEGANARGVAELTIALIFALARAVPESDAAIKAGGWQRRRGIELLDRTVGIVGCGRIGREVAELAGGIGMRCVGFDPFATADGQIELMPLETLLHQADVITLHCPPPEDGRPLLGDDAFKQMRPGVLIVNTARHSLIDRDALAAALDEQRVAGVALDVFDIEPPTDDALLGDPRVIATPHIGGFTSESVDRAVEAAVDNLLTALAREPASTRQSLSDDARRR